MLEEQRGFVEFDQSAGEFYESLTDVVGVVDLWEQLAYLADFNEIDGDLVTEYISDDGPVKLSMGPPFIIVFDHTLSGRMLVFRIQRPSFRRRM